MKKKDFKTKDAVSLATEMKESEEKLRLFRFGGTGGKSKNVKEGMMLRRDIARMKTALRALKA